MPTQRRPQTPEPQAKMQLKSDISGCCFIVRDERGRTQRQGIIHSVVPSQQGDLVLVQYFEWLLGQLNTMALVPLSSMILNDEKSMAGYILFEDDAHLRDYMENVQSRRDKTIDLEASKSNAGP